MDQKSLARWALWQAAQPLPTAAIFGAIASFPAPATLTSSSIADRQSEASLPISDPSAQIDASARVLPGSASLSEPAFHMCALFSAASVFRLFAYVVACSASYATLPFIIPKSGP